MKKLDFTLLLLVFVFASGCAGNRELISRMGTSVRHDVIREVAAGEKAMPGYTGLTVYASLKTHKPGTYSAADSHGSPDYKLLLNIDGQAVEVKATVRNEQTSECASNDPEAGNGIRYLFSKRVLVTTGTHKVAVAIPADEIMVERELALSEGGSNTMSVEPVYGAVAGKQGPGFYGVTSYREGIRSIRLVLNGQIL